MVMRRDARLHADEGKVISARSGGGRGWRGDTRANVVIKLLVSLKPINKGNLSLTPISNAGCGANQT